VQFAFLFLVPLEEIGRKLAQSSTNNANLCDISISYLRYGSNILNVVPLFLESVTCDKMDRQSGWRRGENCCSKPLSGGDGVKLAVDFLSLTWCLDFSFLQLTL